MQIRILEDKVNVKDKEKYFQEMNKKSEEAENLQKLLQKQQKDLKKLEDCFKLLKHENTMLQNAITFNKEKECLKMKNMVAERDHLIGKLVLAEDEIARLIVSEESLRRKLIYIGDCYDKRQKAENLRRELEKLQKELKKEKDCFAQLKLENAMLQNVITLNKEKEYLNMQQMVIERDRLIGKLVLAEDKIVKLRVSEESLRKKTRKVIYMEECQEERHILKIKISEFENIISEQDDKIEYLLRMLQWNSEIGDSKQVRWFKTHN